METAPGLFTLSVWSFNSFCLANTTVSVSYCSNAEKRDQPIGGNIIWKFHYITYIYDTDNSDFVQASYDKIVQ